MRWNSTMCSTCACCFFFFRELVYFLQSKRRKSMKIVVSETTFPIFFHRDFELNVFCFLAAHIPNIVWKFVKTLLPSILDEKESNGVVVVCIPFCSGFFKCSTFDRKCETGPVIYEMCPEEGVTPVSVGCIFCVLVMFCLLTQTLMSSENKKNNI